MARMDLSERATATTSTPQVDAPASVAAQVFPGESEMARLMRAKDWSQTPLGAVETWSQPLHTAISLCLSSLSPIVLWWGPELLVFYNDVYRPSLGATKHPALGKPGREVWPEVWPTIGPLLDSVMANGASTWAEDQLLPLDRYGYLEEVFFTYSYTPIRLESGEVGGVFCVATETTAKVLAERRTRTTRDLAAALVEVRTAEAACVQAAQVLESSADDLPFALLYLLDANGQQACLAGSVGLKSGSSLALPTVDLTGESAESEPWPLARVARTKQREVVTDLAARWGDETVRAGRLLTPHTAIVFPVIEPGKSVPSAMLIAGVSPMLALNDEYEGFYELLVSHLSSGLAAARAYEEERKRAEALAEIDRAKTAFFSNVSHEFRTPLTLMLGPLGDLLADEAALSPDAREQVEVVHRNGLRLAKLVNSLLDFSRIEAGRAQVAYEPTDLAALTADLASAFRSLVERAGLRFVVNCPPLAEVLPQPIYVDRDMWEKIVLNLLSNAFKFTFEGSITVTLRTVEGGTGPATASATVQARPSLPDAVELEVSDTGAGIPAAELPHLFERFRQVQGTRARTHEGSGIGLALVQELVHLHGGTIRVESEEGVGTSVFVRLPIGTAHLPPDRIGAHATLASTALGAAPFVREAERWLPEDSAARDGRAMPMTEEFSAHVPAAPTVPPGKWEASAPPARILLADDNADMRGYLRRLLGARYEVEAVANGADALAAIRRNQPDLVLSDVMMPELDGFALLRALRADPATRTLPVILLSARAGEEATVEGLEAGADDYLIKPFSAREALGRVAARLEIARLRRETEARAHELETAIEAVADAVFIYDREGKIAHMNLAARTLFGLDALPGYAESLPQQRAALISVRDHQGRLMPVEESGLYRLLRGEALTGADALDVRLRLPDGRELEVNIAGAPLRDEVGTITGAIAISRDVTARNRLERRTHDALDALLRLAAAAVSIPGAGTDVADDLDDLALGRHAVSGETLRRLARLCSQVFDSERVAIITMDPDSELLTPVAVTGGSPDQEQRFRAGFGQLRLTDRFGSETAAHLKAGKTVLMDVERLRTDDPTHLLSRRHFLIAPMLSTIGLIGYVGVNFGDDARHYTPQNRALASAVAQLVGMVMERERLMRERELARASELAAEDANRRMNDFLGIASHELRTPLTSVTANVQMAERALRPLAEADRGGSVDNSDATLRHAHEMLERAKRQVIRLDRLVGDLLDASRIQAGKLELRWEICDLRAVVREAVEAQRAAWPKRDITLELPPRSGVVVRADSDRIGQVVTNYLTNALKYSAHDRPVAVRLRRHRGGVRVEVRDGGPGLSAEQQSHLFERFSRAPGVEQQSGSGVGLGLGLYICKTIVERHGGRLGVESVPGMGSTFWFTLPLPQARRGE